MFKELYAYDKELLIALNQLGIESYDAFWITVTHIATWIPLFLFFGVLIFRVYPLRKATAVLLIILTATALVLLITEGVKEYVGRLRPNNNPEINQFIRVLKNPGNYSFFSGHASTSFAITTLVVLFLRKHFKWVYIFYVWPVLFGLSRIYVGVHYPTDVVFGMLTGILLGVVFYKIHGFYVKKKQII